MSTKKIQNQKEILMFSHWEVGYDHGDHHYLYLAIY